MSSAGDKRPAPEPDGALENEENEFNNPEMPNEELVKKAFHEYATCQVYKNRQHALNNLTRIKLARGTRSFTPSEFAATGEMNVRFAFCDLLVHRNELMTLTQRQQVKINQLKSQLLKQKNFVDIEALKAEAINVTTGILFMGLFRSMGFLSSKENQTSKFLLSDEGGLDNIEHPFVKTCFAFIFAALEKKFSDMPNGKAPRTSQNIYSNGEKHLLNNPEGKKLLWSDFNFASSFIGRFHSKRNKFSWHIRSLFSTYYVLSPYVVTN